MISVTGVLYPTAVMGVLGLAFGALLAFASIKFFVATDERVSRMQLRLPERVGQTKRDVSMPGRIGFDDQHRVGMDSQSAPFQHD